MESQVEVTSNRMRAPSDTGAASDKMRYDEAGNLVWDEYTNPSNPARDFSYDAENRIVSVKSGSGAELARYVYDADGRRVRRIVWNGASFVETWLVYGMEGIKKLLSDSRFDK